MEEALNNTKSTNERLKINADENYITDPKLDDHADQCAPQCEVTLQNCKNLEFSEDKELTTAEGHTSFTNKRALSNCTNNDDDDLKKVLLGEDGGKSMNGSSSKTVVIQVMGVKNSVCPSNILNSVGNDESSLDIGIQRKEEVACHLFGQPSSLETMRKRFASYINYSGSDSGTSDSESLDLNDQNKDGFQTDQIIQNREQEISAKCHNSSNGLQENKKKADENSEAEKESSFSGNNRKFSMKWNITAKKVESIKSLTPVQGIWEEDALMSHTEDRRLHNALEMRTSVRRSSSNSVDENTQAGEDPGKIFDDKEDIFHGQIQTNAFLVNEESNRCTSENGMTARHDSSRNGISIHAEETQKNTFKVNKECSRDELYEQELEDSKEMSSGFKQGNGNLKGSKESELKDKDCTKIERPTNNYQNTNKSIKNANANILSLNCSRTQERSLKNERSKIKTSSLGFGLMTDSSPCSSSNTSHVERFQKHYEQVLSHNEEKKSEKVNSVTKYRSSDRETKNLAIKKECLDSGIASDESVAFRNRKSDVHNDLKNGSREAEGKNSASKQTLLERRTCKVNEAEKETRSDDAKRKPNRHQTGKIISLGKENGLQKKSARESPSMDKQTAKQSHLDNEEDSQKSFPQRRSVSPAEERWKRKSRESRSRERESIYVKRSRVESNDAEDLKGRDYRSRSTRRSASPANERWQRKSRESTSTDRESKCLKSLNLDDDDWKSSSWHRDSRRSASPARERWQRKSPERTSPDRERKLSHVDDNDYESKSNYYRTRSRRRSASPAREHWQRKSPERTSPDRERKLSHVNDADDDSNSSYYLSRNSRRSASPARERWQQKSPERTSLDRESKRSHLDDADDCNSKGKYYRSRSPRRSASNEKGRWQRNSRERTSRERDSRYSKQSHEDDDDHDWKSYSWPRRDSRRSVSRERGRWQRTSRERTSLDRERKRSHVDDDDDYESNSTYHHNRSPRPSASPARERWHRTSRERTSLDRESRRSHDDNDDWKSSCRRRNSRRSASLEKKHWRRKRRERTSLDRESRRSHVDNDDDDDWKSSCRRNSRRSASLEKEHWRRKSRERTSLDKESRRSHVDNDDDDDWKSSSWRRNSRRSASLENERRQRTSRMSRSTERESEHAVGNSRNRNKRTFRSSAPRPSSMRQDQITRRRLISESPEMSWIHDIVVKIADPPRFPIRKRRNQKDRRFIQRSQVERSRNTTDKPTTSENKSENDTALKKKRRWTYDDYTKQTDGSLKRKRDFSDEEEEHYAWKRYDDERTMPYQGYADSQVQSLLKQLCGDYITKLYSKENSNKENASCQNAHGNDKNVKKHRSWFMTSSEWIVHGGKDTRAEDLTKQTVTFKDPSTTTTITTTTTVPVVWYTVPHMISTKDGYDCEEKTNTEKENQARTDKVYDKKELGQPSTQKESLTTKDKVAIETSPVDNIQSQNGRKQNQTVHSDASEETAIDSNVGIDSVTFDFLGSMDSWNTSTSCNDASVAGQMARNDLLVMVTPSSYWYEKQFLQGKNENLSTEESKTDHQPSLHIPTSFSSSRLTNVSSFSTCFHCDTMYEFSPQIPDSSGVGEKNEQKRKDLILEHDTTPQTGTRLMKSRCNTKTGAKRKLNFDSIIVTPSSDDLKNSVIEDDKTDPTETIKSDQELETTDKTVDSVCSSDSTSKLKITSTGSPIQNILPKMVGSSSRGTIPNLPNLKMPSNSTANECRPLENLNSKEENRNSNGKNDDQQFVEEDSGVAFSETTETPFPKSNIPQKKLEKENDHQLVEGEIADGSQKNENNSPRTSLPRTNIGMDIISSSILKVVAEDPKCKAGEDMWELALKSTSSKTSDDLDNPTLDKGAAFTKSHSKSGDLDIAVVKPSPRQKYGTAVSETSETFANPDDNVNIINPANPGNTRKESSGAAKMPVQKKQLVSQIKVTKNLEFSKNPSNSSSDFPSPAFGVVASTPHDPSQNVPKRPLEGRLTFVDAANEEFLAAGVSKKLTENVPHEILPLNVQRAWGADLRNGAQGPHIRLLQTPAHFVHQNQYGHSFQTPNPQQQQQQEQSHMTQSPFYNKVVAQHHNMNNDHPSTNTSVNAKVMPPLSNLIKTLPEQQEGNSDKLLQNQTVFIDNSPLVVNQQHVMMPKRDIRPGNDSFQGILLDAQNNLRPSMPPLNESLVAQGIDQVHAIHPLRYPTVTGDSVYFQPPEHQHQQLPFQQQLHLQQQQHHQQQQQQQQLQQQQQQQLHRHHHQQQIRQQQHIQYQTQQQRQQQQQNLQQHQQMQQQQRNSQQSLQQQQTIPDGSTTIHQQQATTVVTAQPPRHYPILEESSQLEKWHDDFLKASINQDNLSHIPWGQHALDLGYRGDLRMFPQYRQIQAPLPPNAPTLFFNAQNSLSE